MKPSAGLWIDHGKAVIVMISDQGQQTKRIESKIQRQFRRSGGSSAAALFESRVASSGDSRERDRAGNRAIYYDQVITGIGAAVSVLIFGPGEAKGELKKRIERNACTGRRIEMETTGRMTERQIVQKVRKHFSTVRGPAAPIWDATPPENMNCEG